MAVALTASAGPGPLPPAPILSLRRGRPRYRIGYIAEVLNYINAQQRKNKGRPVHIALSIACRDLRISKRTWLRMVRTLEACHWLWRDPKVGGENNKGTLYALLDPPSGRHRLEYASSPPFAPVVVTDGERSRGVDVDAPIRNLIAETVISNTDRTFFHTPSNGAENGGNRIPGTFQEVGAKVPLIRIDERSLGERSCPSDNQGPRPPIEEPPARPSADPETPPGPRAGRANLPPNPSLTAFRSTGRGVPIRYSDGTATVIPRSRPDAETEALIRTIVSGSTKQDRARAYLEAVARYEANNTRGEAMPIGEVGRSDQGGAVANREPATASHQGEVER